MACWTSTDVEVIYSLSISRDNEDCGNINSTPDKELTTNLEMSVPEMSASFGWPEKIFLGQ